MVGVVTHMQFNYPFYLKWEDAQSCNEGTWSNGSKPPDNVKK